VELEVADRGQRTALYALDSVDGLTAELAGAVGSLDVKGWAEFLRRAVERITWDGETAEMRFFFAARNCANHQHIVIAGRGHFQCPLCRGLPAHIAKIG
jgi:hypothetical protein